MIHFPVHGVILESPGTGQKLCAPTSDSGERKKVQVKKEESRFEQRPSVS